MCSDQCVYLPLTAKYNIPDATLDPHMEGSDPHMEGSQNLAFEGPRAVWSVWDARIPDATNGTAIGLPIGGARGVN